MPAPSVLRSYTGVRSTTTSPVTVSSVDTTGGSGNKCLIIKVAAGYNASAISSVTFNSSSTGITLIEKLAVVGTAGYAAAYYLANPTATTADVVVNYGGGSHSFAVIVEVWQDCHATTPVGTQASFATSGGTTSTAVTVTTGVTGDTITDVLCIRKAITTTGTATVDGSQAEVQNVASTANNNLACIAASSTEAGSASVAMSWTHSNNYASIIAWPMKAAVAATSSGRLVGGVLVNGVLSRGLLAG